MSKVLFAVEGCGEFPFDMLRTDECWPNQPSDVQAMLQEHGRREITLLSNRVYSPTKARWDSFGWTVTKVDY